MRKFYLLIAGCVFIATAATLLFLPGKKYSHRAPLIISNAREEKEGDEGYDGAALRDQQEFEQLKDPALGSIPFDQLVNAIDYTHHLKDSLNGIANRGQSIMLWQERGPIYDSVGPNGNPRGNDGYTSGRMAAVLVDTLNDPSGNTVIVGGISGGVWKCTNFLSSIPNWRNVNDYFDNMSISSICEDPTNPSVMYFSTGEATANADAYFGSGIWKSTDKGETWNRLPSTINYNRTFKIVCDVAGNIYIGERPSNTYGAVIPTLPQLAGLLRSNDGGATWTDITPTNLTSSNKACSDIEISSTGRFHASFGYVAAGAAIVNHRYTDNPATVTTAAGWNISTGIKQTATCVRLEMACQADTLYGITIANSGNIDSCYKSINGGVTWTKQNTAVYPTGITNTQAWYDITLAINPNNSSEFLTGGLDAYRSINSGVTAATRTTFWVTSIPYVHADHHYMSWWKKGTESRIVIGCDGGIFYSNDGGVTWSDKNRNLGLKQFYAADIHPAAGSPYLLAGAQDNGTHAFYNPGLSYSFEVDGGDGMYVHINQQNPNVQFGAYVYNQYWRTTNGGVTWGGVNFSGNQGMFTNPFDYDDAQNIMYACYSANNILRWPNANTANTSNTFAVAALNGQAASLKVSPYTTNRVYLGSTTGRVIRLDNANATPTITNISGASFPNGPIHCVNVGSSDNNLVATFTNFGIPHVWNSTDGGTTWTNIDGNLPNMPVWWALYDPNNNNKMYLATETGIWTTDLINGASTIWIPNPAFPTTRTAMLKMRTSDNTVVAATYGRGLFTATIPPPTPSISFVAPSSTVVEQTAGTTGCRNYKDYTVNVGIVNIPTGDATVTYSVQAGATATQGVDFDFTTNGSFIASSNQHVFTSGQMAVKPITVRVYDDAEVETSESFVINFTISGATNAVVGPMLTHTFTIQDNDRYPIPFVNAGTFTVGTYNTDMTSLNTPFDGTKLKHRLQVVYRANELVASGIQTGATISALKIRVKTKNTTQPFKGFTIQMANTFKTTLAAGFVTGIPFTQVYSADYSTVAGDNLFNFSTPFVWYGTSNVVMQLCFDNSPGTAEGVVDIVEGMAAPFGTGNRASTYSNYTTSTSPGCALAAAFIDDNRMNAGFTATFGNPVATVLNSTGTQFLGSKSDVYYYTNSGEIMARVLNLSTQNYGCTQVLIDRAGTGVSQFWNTNTANYLMNKTFRVLPTTNNATGKYEVTFYFTAAEKAGWEAATGKPWDSIQIIKLPSRILNVTPLNAQPDGPGTIEVIDAVKRTFGPNYYTLSAIFNTGFSGFGFGIPGRMNTILTLTGQIDANNKDIDLSWTTSAEINSTVFEVEKSYDGINFRSIGSVQAAANKLTPSTYTFVDHENVQFNYYRIKMLHTDGYVLYSNVVFIQKDNAPQRLIVGPNPFGSSLTVRFARTPTGPVYFSFFDNGGKLVKQYQVAGGSPSYIINTSGILSRAIYTLRVDADGKTDRIITSNETITLQIIEAV